MENSEYIEDEDLLDSLIEERKDDDLGDDKIMMKSQLMIMTDF